MTVKELKQQLENFPDNAEVIIDFKWKTFLQMPDKIIPKTIWSYNNPVKSLCLWSFNAESQPEKAHLCTFQTFGELSKRQWEL